MKPSLALALAAFLGLGLLSTTFAGFAQDAHRGVTSWRGGYGTAVGAVPYQIAHFERFRTNSALAE